MSKFQLYLEYYWYDKDEFMDLPDEVIDFFKESFKESENRRVKAIQHLDIYSLDVGDGIENEILFAILDPEELYEKKEAKIALYAALCMLPKIQCRRLVAFYFKKKTMTEIAASENVSVKAVSSAIHKGEKNLKEILERGFKKG